MQKKNINEYSHMTEYRLKTPKAIEDTVVKAYKGIENCVVGVYKKIEGKFVDTFLIRVDELEDVSAVSDDEQSSRQ